MGVRIGRDHQYFSDCQRERQEYKVQAYVQTQQGEQKWRATAESKINLSLVQEQAAHISVCLRIKLFVPKDWISDWIFVEHLLSECAMLQTHYTHTEASGKPLK